LEGSDAFVRARPAEDAGCLYFSQRLQSFVDPDRPGVGAVVRHFGEPGGVLPRIIESDG
jgi:hypothetical protein